MSASRHKASRRFLLTAAVCLVHQAKAEVPAKISRAAAQYQDTPRGGLRCVGCTFFRRPASCQVVEGDISPNGWCRLFDVPD